MADRLLHLRQRVEQPVMPRTPPPRFPEALDRVELGAVAGQPLQLQVRSGTPLYQAPEQLAGRDVTIRSDLYALGLVLYELFTGKRAFANETRGTPPSKPSSHVSHLDPAVERVILRCLEANPADRPRSALEVLGGLPGGDPLAAALAAGETPSPQLVAEGGEPGLIKPWVGLSLLGGLVLLIAVMLALSPYVRMHNLLPTIASPGDQHRTAEELLDRLGVGPGRYTASGYVPSESHLRLIQARATGSDRFPHLRGGRTHVLSYFYRRSPDLLTLGEDNARVTHERPATNVPGMAGVKLDVRGHLLELYRTPEIELPPALAGHTVDWTPLLTAAKLDSAKLESTTPQWTPPVFADKQAAWDVTDADGVTFHAEAAALRGQLVWFFLAHEQEEPVSDTNRPANSYGWIVVALMASLFFGSTFLAVRNVIRRRVDWRGAAWIVAFYVVGTCLWLLGQTQMPNSFRAGISFFLAIVRSMVLGGLMPLTFYLALEPVVRRRWPWQLSAWSRLVSLQIRHPLVGRDVLIGLSAGAAFLALQALSSLVLVRLIGDPTQTLDVDEFFASGVISSSGYSLSWGLIEGMVQFILFLIILLLVRKTWIAWLVWIVLVTAFAFTSKNLVSDEPVALMSFLAITILRYGLVALVIARFGLLAVCALNWSRYLLLMPPLTTSTSAWYFWEGVSAALLLLALAGYAFYTATGGQRVFKEGFFGDE